MGVHEGHGQLNKAYKELKSRWAQTQHDWDDAASRQFAEKYLTPLEYELRLTGNAMDLMARLLSQIRAECE